MNDHKKKAKGKIISIFLGIIFSLVCLEIFLRLIGFIYNSDRNTPEERKNKFFKILTVGNSYTAGVGAPPRQSYPAHLQRTLARHKPGKYQVINRGKGNVNSTYILENLPEWLKQDRPQVVFVMTGEPNSWNKYGLSQFLEKNKLENRSYINWDLLRWSKVFRLIELTLNKDEEFSSKKNVKYSTYFRNIELIEKNKEQLSYLWLGVLQDGDHKEYFALSDDQTAEAIGYLKYIFEKDKNILAGSSLAQLYFVKHKDLENFLAYNEAAVKYSTHFNLSLYKRMSGYGLFMDAKYKKRYLKLKKSIENLPKELPLDVLIEWSNKPYSKKFNSIEEENDFLFKYYKSNPATLKVGDKLFSNGADSSKVFDILEHGLRLNPLSPVVDLYMLNSEVGKIHSELKPRITKLLEDLSIILNDKNLKEDFYSKEVEAAWIINDLNKIVEVIKKSGAKVVIQTYPPTRKNINRFADGVIRSWWNNLNDKSEIEFMDVGSMLKSKFDEDQGGDIYFSSEYGPLDNHQSVLGNIEIAKIMAPVVIKLEARAPKEAVQ